MKKQAELQRILSPLGINVLTAEMAGIELSDVDETGTTFEENAFLKADSGCKESGMVCVADDSGLMVDYLDGAPGVYSARFGGEELAKRRQSQYAKQIEFCVADATNRKSILELKRNRAFTKAVSNIFRQMPASACATASASSIIM